MRLRPIALVVFLLLLGAGAVAAVEHPGVLHEGDDCSSCHASKTTRAFGDGEPVYDLSSGSNSRRHDDSALNLPKEQICFACPREVSGIAATYSCGAATMCGVSRFAQQRAADAAAGSKRSAGSRHDNVAPGPRARKSADLGPAVMTGGSFPEDRAGAL
jgi:hypothetical protein